MRNGAWILVGGLILLPSVAEPSLYRIFEKICVLLSTEIALSLVSRLRCFGRSWVAVRDRGAALFLFLLLGLVEDCAVRDSSWCDHRIVAVTAASLLAGLGVGIAVRLFLIWLILSFGFKETTTLAILLSSGGVLGGVIRRWRPKLAAQPLTGFYLATSISFLRNLSVLFCAPSRTVLPNFAELCFAPILQGVGTALTMKLVAQARQYDEQTLAVTKAELRTFQARLNPRFLGDALNSVTGFAATEPQKIPPAIGRLRHFLRASFDQPERPLVHLEEELSVVTAFLEIEALRLPGKLEIARNVDSRTLKALIPSFSLQGLVENAIEHGRPSLPTIFGVNISISSKSEWLEMRVSDNGNGVSRSQVERVFFREKPRPGRLWLLRRQLKELFGDSFTLEISSDLGAGTTAILRLPLQVSSPIFPPCQ
jgi:LytS/YehU family sensor histidine kinase